MNAYRSSALMALPPAGTSSSESAAAKAAPTEPPAAESARTQASPAAKTLRSVLPAAKTVGAVFTKTIVKSAERIRPAERIVRSRPRVRLMFARKLMRLESVCGSAIRGGSLPSVAIAVAMVVGVVEIPAVPGRVAAKIVVVERHGSGVPIGTPGTPAPAAIARQRADRNTGSESQQRTGGYFCRSVPRSDIRDTVNG